MAHKRREIRAHVVALLKGASTTAGQRIYPSRVRPGVGLTYPIVAIYTPKEDVTLLGTAPHEYARTLELVIECIDENIDTDVENRLDILMNEIEELIDTNENMIVDISDVQFMGSSVDVYNTGEKNMASGVMRYTIRYYTVEDIPHPGFVADVEVNGTWVNAQ